MTNSTNISTNIPTMTVNNFIRTMTPIYTAFAGRDDIKFPALMLWGAPGVGKSDAIKQIANTVAEKLGRTASVTDVRLLLYNPVDLRGIPTADANKEFAKWLKPHIFNMDASKEVVNFLVLDEITAAPQSVQAAAYQIVLDRQIGEHKLPDNCIVLAAGNRITDKSVAYSMPKALCNRMTHIEIEPTVDDWKEWALKKNIDYRILSFVTYKPNALLAFDPSSQEQAYPTPRSWERVGDFLKINSDIKAMRPMIEGTIGLGTSIEFISYCKVFDKLPDIKAIVDGKYHEYPEAPDVNHALVTSLVNYIITHDVTDKQLDNAVAYINGMSAEFAILTAKDILISGNRKLTSRILATDSWDVFTEQYESFVNDYIS
jgi:hypothetical protein